MGGAGRNGAGERIEGLLRAHGRELGGVLVTGLSAARPEIKSCGKDVTGTVADMDLSFDQKNNVVP